MTLSHLPLFPALQMIQNYLKPYMHSGNDTNLLQEDLNNLSNWSESSGLNINELKSNYQTVTRKRAPLFHQYTNNGMPIGRLDEELDHRVRVNSKL